MGNSFSHDGGEVDDGVGEEVGEEVGEGVGEEVGGVRVEVPPHVSL